MGKYKELVEDHLNARVTRNKVASDVLGTLKGEVETYLKSSDKDPDIVTEEMAKRVQKGLEAIGGDQAKEEMEYIEPYLPQTMSENQIVAELSKLDLTNMGMGQKMGAAMKALGGKADGNTVRAVIQKYYE